MDGWQLSRCNQLIDFCASYPKRLCSIWYSHEEPLRYTFLGRVDPLCQDTHGDVSKRQALTYNWKGAEGADAGVFGAISCLTQRLLNVLSSAACRKM